LQTNAVATVPFKIRAQQSGIQMQFQEPSSIFVLSNTTDHRTNAVSAADLPFMNELMDQGITVSRKDRLSALPRHQMEHMMKDRAKFFCKSVDEWRQKWTYVGQMRSDMLQATLPYGGSYASNPPPGMYGTSYGAVNANISRVIGVDVTGMPRAPNVFAESLAKADVLYYAVGMFDSTTEYMQASDGSIIGNYERGPRQTLQVRGMSESDSSVLFHNTNPSEYDPMEPNEADTDFIEKNKRIMQEYLEPVVEDGEVTRWRQPEGRHDMDELIWDAYATCHVIRVGVVKDPQKNTTLDRIMQAHRDRVAYLDQPIVTFFRHV
jgi:hypothetical protein